MRTMFNWILPVNSRFDQSWHTCSVVVELWWERGEGWTGYWEERVSCDPDAPEEREKGEGRGGICHNQKELPGGFITNTGRPGANGDCYCH